MRASLFTRAAAVAATTVIATTGGTAVAGAAGAAAAHAHAHIRPHTHLSIATKPVVEHHKHATVIAGRLTTVRGRSLPGRVVFLFRLAPKHWPLNVGREVTGKFGGVAFVVDPKIRTHYVLVFEGTRRFHSGHSRVVSVKD
jgi:hypothetical protein